MAERGRYRTRQRELVETCLANNAGRYLTVDEMLALIVKSGESVGRTTVYRTLEALASDGAALKAPVPGGEARYRAADCEAAGQLVCLTCGKVFPLDCHAALDLAAHVFDRHDFSVDPVRTVLYGTCGECMKDGRG